MISERDIIRGKVFTSTLFATKFFFKQRFGRKFVTGDHHVKISEVLDKVYSGEIKRLIITLPPRYSKTEMAVKSFIAKGLAVNPRSKFIHLSYSAELAIDNSDEARDIVSSEWYQELFPDVKIDRKSNAKHKWYTTVGGGVYATSTAGQVTGFGAGEVDEDEELEREIEILERDSVFSFAGAIVIDDPLKPDDASSVAKREKVNERFDSTIRSRTNSRNTPIIIIMQRLNKKDLVGYLTELEGTKDNGGEWCVLSLPAISIDQDGNEEALWPFKQTIEELKKLKKANRFVFETQYQQNPKGINEKRWCFAFNEDKHTGVVKYNPNEFLYQSWDFNVSPMTCSLWQHYGGVAYCIEAIEADNATTRTVCEIIEKKYPNAHFFVTGDRNGGNRSTNSYVTNFGVIQNYFNLSVSQMKVSSVNPMLEDSRYFVNSIFEQYPVIIDKENCKPLIKDLNEVLSDDNNKPIKDSRSNVAQRSDHLDNLRYFMHKFLNKVL